MERYRLDEVKFALVIGSGGDSLNRYRRRLAPVRTPVVARTPLPPPFSRKIFNLRGLRRVPRCKILVSLRLSVKSSLETTYENCCIASAHFMVQFILALVSLFTLSIPRARFAGLRDQASSLRSRKPSLRGLGSLGWFFSESVCSGFSEGQSALILLCGREGKLSAKRAQAFEVWIRSRKERATSGLYLRLKHSRIRHLHQKYIRDREHFRGVPVSKRISARSIRA